MAFVCCLLWGAAVPLCSCVRLPLTAPWLPIWVRAVGMSGELAIHAQLFVEILRTI